MDIKETVMKAPKWENYLTDSPKLREAISVLSQIEKAGYEAYIVGGTPRDMILGKSEIDDIDIATNCPINMLDKMFSTYDIGQSRDFGIVRVRSQRKYFEVAQFRQDGEYKDGRRPEDVQIVDNLQADIRRRDFTINALALTKDGEIIDHIDGISDIESKIIRAVGDPYKRFEEDFVRMIRAARFGAIEGFTIADDTYEAIKKMSHHVTKVTPERARLELIKAANRSGKMFAKFVVLLEEFTLLKHILPEVSDLKNFPHILEHHPEGPAVWDHVVKCLEISDDHYLSKLAILLHDIGKARTLKYKANGSPQYYYHAKLGSRMVADVCDRLRFSSFEKEALVYATENHMKWHRILEMKPSKIARMLESPYFETLLDVCRADQFSRGEAFMYKEEFEKQLKKVLDVKEKWEDRIVEHKLKLVDGKRIMELTGLKPCAAVGIVKKDVEDEIVDNGIDPQNQKEIDDLIMSTYGRYYETA